MCACAFVSLRLLQFMCFGNVWQNHHHTGSDSSSSSSINVCFHLFEYICIIVYVQRRKYSTWECEHIKNVWCDLFHACLDMFLSVHA